MFCFLPFLLPLFVFFSVLACMTSCFNTEDYIFSFCFYTISMCPNVLFSSFFCFLCFFTSIPAYIIVVSTVTFCFSTFSMCPDFLISSYFLCVFIFFYSYLHYCCFSACFCIYSYIFSFCFSTITMCRNILISSVFALSAPFFLFLLTLLLSFCMFLY